jgi:outer membrane protein, adhesin transport system
MSNSTHTARTDRREEQLIKDVVRRRPLFSAFGALVGTGVVALSAVPSQAQARSALDDMQWAPQQHAQLTRAPVVAQAARIVLNETVGNAIVPAPDMSQQPRSVSVSSPVTTAMPSAPQADTAPTPALAATARSLARKQATAFNAAPQGRVESAPSAPAMPRSRGFADAGLIPVDNLLSNSNDANAPSQAQAAQPAASVAREIAPVAVPVRSEPAREMLAPGAQRMAAPAPLGLSASPIRPAVSTRRAPDMQADIIALRGSIAAGSANTFDGDDMSSASSAQAVSPVRRAAPTARTGGNDAGAPTQKDLRKGRGAEDNYADWLDDTRSAKSFADTTVVPEQAVRAALRNAADAAAARSPALKQARNDWDAAKFDVDQVKGQRYPQIQVGANSPAITGDSASFNQYNRPTASIAITTLIYDFGKTSKSIDSRTKTAEAAEFYFQTLAQQNAYETSTNLVELAKFRAVYAIGENYVKRMSQLVQMLEAIVKVDPGRLSELTQAKSRLLQAQTSQETVAAQARTQEIAVQKLVGTEPTPMPAGTHWQFMLDGVDSAVTAVAQNPAIAQADAEAAAAKLSAQSVRADSLPKLNWVINKNTASDVFGNRQPWSTMLQLSWTPFQGGSQRAAERAALSRASSSLDKRDQLALDSEFKVRDAYHDALAMSTRAKLYDQLSTESDLIRKQFFEQWYHLNRRTLLDVLSAESDFYNNQVSATTTQFDAYQAVLKIHLNNGTLNQWLQEG